MDKSGSAPDLVLVGRCFNIVFFMSKASKGSSDDLLVFVKDEDGVESDEMAVYNCQKQEFETVSSLTSTSREQAKNYIEDYKEDLLEYLSES